LKKEAKTFALVTTVVSDLGDKSKKYIAFQLRVPA
jgi:hypothetical protein